MRRPSFGPSAFWSALVGCFVGYVAGFVVTNAVAKASALGVLLQLGLCAGGALLFVAATWARRWSGRPAPVELDAQAITLASPIGASRARRVPYEDIDAVHVFHGAEVDHVLLDTRRGTYLVPGHAFVDPHHARVMLEELRAQISSRGGSERLVEMKQREGWMRTVLARQPVVTRALLTTLIGVFIVELILGVTRDSSALGLVRLGANAPALIERGEIFRLVSANFLHANEIHILVNGVSIASLGGVLERLLLRSRFIVVYLASAFAGAATAVWMTGATVSVGASTAVFGLLGAFAVMHLRYGSSLPAPFRQTALWWAFNISLNAALPILIPQIDVAAHVGGFIAGAILGWLVLPEGRTYTPIEQPTPGISAAAIALAGITLLGLGWAFVHAIGDSKKDMEHIAEHYVAERSPNPEWANAVAWTIAIDPDASSSALVLAEELAKRVVKAMPREAALVDTLATTQYRLDHLDEAIATQRRALERLSKKDPEELRQTYASQLARFYARRASVKSSTATGTEPASMFRLTYERGGNHGAITLRGAKAIQAPKLVYAIPMRRGRLLGLVRMCVGPEHARETRFALTKETQWLRAARFDIVDVDAASREVCPPPTPSHRAWRMVPEVATYP